MFLLQPSSALLALFVLGLVLIWFGRGPLSRYGRLILASAAFLYIVLAYTPLARLLLQPLEDRFPAQAAAKLPEPPKGIIVLGGAINSEVTRGRKRPATNEAGERFTVAVALARQFPNAVLLVSNGGGHRIDHDDPFGYAEYRLLEGLGVARQRIIYERASSNTYENAVMGYDMVKPKAGELWLLVTSAKHMPRAVGSFRKAGFDVLPWPVDYWTPGPDSRLGFFGRASVGLKFSDAAAKEWLGLLFYYFAGRTDALFPKP